MRRRPAALEQAGRRQHEAARADGADDLGRGRDRAEVTLDGLATHRGHGSGPAGHDDGERPGDLGKGPLRRQGQADIRHHRFPALAHDHGPIRCGQALQDLQGPDEVEERHLGVEHQGDDLLGAACGRFAVRRRTPRSRGRHNGGPRRGDRVRKRPDPFDRAGGHVTRLHEDGRVAGGADAGGTPGGDHVPRLQGQDVRGVVQHLVDVVRHARRARVLHRRSRERERDPELVRVGEELLRHDEGPEGCEGVVALAQEPVGAVPRIAASPPVGDVVLQRVAEDVLAGALRRHVVTPPAHHHGQLALPVDPVAPRRDADRLPVGDHGRPWLDEQVGIVPRVVRPPRPDAGLRLRWRGGCRQGLRPALHLRAVLGVVHGRVEHGLGADRGPDLQGLQLVDVAGTGRGGAAFPGDRVQALAQAVLVPLDQLRHVGRHGDRLPIRMARLEVRVGGGDVHHPEVREHDAEQRAPLPRERSQLERRFRPSGSRRQQDESENRSGRCLHTRLQVWV